MHAAGISRLLMMPTHMYACSGLTFSGLAVLALSVGGANGKISFGKFSKSLSYGKSKSSTRDYRSTTKTISASVKCSSDAYAESSSDHTNDYIKAGAPRAMAAPPRAARPPQPLDRPNLSGRALTNRNLSRNLSRVGLSQLLWSAWIHPQLRSDRICRAVTNLVKDVCNPSWNGNLQTLRDDMVGWAGAWARVRPPPPAMHAPRPALFLACVHESR